MSELYYQLEEVDKELWYNPENPHLTETNVRAITRLNELRDDVLALVSDRSQKLEPNDEDLLLSIVRKFSRLSQRAGILVQDKNIHIVPVSIYLDDAFTEETVKETEAAVANFALRFGFEVLRAGPEEWGSWFKELFFRSRRAMTSESAETIFAQAERSLEVRALLLPQTGTDPVQTDAAARLIESLAGVSNAVIQIGPILLIKADGVLHLRSLNQEELARLEHNGWLLKEPKEALEVFNRISGEQSRPIPPPFPPPPAGGYQ